MASTTQPVKSRPQDVVGQAATTTTGPTDAARGPTTALDVLNGIIEPMGAIAASRATDADVAAYKRNRELLEEMTYGPPGPVRTEALALSADIAGYQRWAVGGFQGAPKTRLVRDRSPVPGYSDLRLVAGGATERGFITGGAPLDKVPVSDEFASYLVDDGRATSRYYRDLLGRTNGEYDHPLERQEDGTFRVEHPELGMSSEIPVEEFWRMWPRIRASVLGYTAIPGAVDWTLPGAFHAGAGVLGSMVDQATQALASIAAGREVSLTADTARPGTKFLTFPMGPEGFVGGDYEELRLKDPRSWRAIETVVGILSQNSNWTDEDRSRASEAFGFDIPADAKLDRNWLEALSQTGGFLADFAGVSKIAGAIGGAATRAGAALDLPIQSLKVETVKEAAEVFGTEASAGRVLGARLSAPWFSPGAAHGLRTVAGFGLYELAHTALGDPIEARKGPSETAAGSLLHGVAEGAKIVGLGAVLRMARVGALRVLGKFDTKSPIGAAVRRYADAEGHFTGLGMPAPEWMAKELPRVFRQGDRLADAVRRVGLTHGMASYLGQAIDSIGLGLTLGAYADAQTDPDWHGMTVAQKGARILAGLSSPDAVGNAMAFGLGTSLHAARFGWSMGRTVANLPPEARKVFDQTVRSVAEQVSNAPTIEDAVKLLPLFDKLKAAEPDLFQSMRIGELELAKQDKATRARVDPYGQTSPVVLEERDRAAAILTDQLRKTGLVSDQAPEKSDPERYIHRIYAAGHRDQAILRDAFERVGLDYGEARAFARKIHEIDQQIASERSLDHDTMARILEANWRDPRYAGWSPFQIIDDVWNRGGPLERGAPGGESLSIDLLHADMVHRAATSMEHVEGVGKLAGLLQDTTDRPTSESTVRLALQIHQSAWRTGEEIDRIKQAVEAIGAKFEDVRASATEAVTQMRTLARELAKTDKTLPQAWKDRMEQVFRVRDGERNTGLPFGVDPAVMADLEAVGLAENGSIIPAAWNYWIGWMDLQLTKLRQKNPHAEEAYEAFFKVHPALPFASSEFGGDFAETPVARALRLSNFVESGASNRVKPFLPWVHRLLDYAGGLWQNNALTREQRKLQRDAIELVFSPTEAEARTKEAMAQEVLTEIAAKVGEDMPRSHQRMMKWLMDKGIFRRIPPEKGRETLEKIRKGTGYLYEVMQDAQGLLADYGKELVSLGYLAPDQLRLRQQQYFPRYPLRDKKAQSAIDKAISRGSLPIHAAGRRNMMRKADGEAAVDLMIDEPNYALTRYAGEGTQLETYFGVLRRLKAGGYSISEEQYARLPEWQKSAWLPATISTKEGLANFGSRRELQPSMILNELLHRQRRDFAAGARQKIAPYTKIMKNLQAYWLGESGAGKRYLPRGVMAELGVVFRDLFNPPPSDAAGWWGKFSSKALDPGTRFVRRGFTVLRGKYWTLNITDALVTNAVTGALHWTDFIKSYFTGHGYYADSARDMLGLLELARTGKPSEKPQGWSDEFFQRVKRLENGIDALTGGTFIATAIESRELADLVGGIMRPDQTAQALRQMLDERRIPEESREGYEATIADFQRRASRGLLGMDERIFKALGHRDAHKRAQGVAEFTGMSQLWEIWMRWAGALRLLDQHANLPLRRAMTIAAAGTGDFRNASPIARAYSKTWSTFTNPLWKMTSSPQGHLMREGLMREFLKGRFWLYGNTMAATRRKALFVRPTTVMAGFLMSAAVKRLLTYFSDPDEQQSFEEAMRGSLMQPTSNPPLDKAAADLFKKAYPNGVWMPDPTYQTGAEDRSTMWELFRDYVIDGKALLFEAPSSTGETRATNVEQLVPGMDLAGDVRGVRQFFSRSLDENVQVAADNLSVRAMELPMVVASGVATLLTKQGPDILKAFRRTVGQMVPEIYPLFPLSQLGQQATEILLLNGQRFEDWVRGHEPAGGLSSDNEVLADLALRGVWRSQAVMQPRSVAPDDSSAAEAIARQLDLISTDPRDPANRDQIEGAKWVNRQLGEILEGAYTGFTRDGLSGVYTWDAVLAQHLGWGQEGDGSTMDKALARLPSGKAAGKDDVQEYARRYWRRLLLSPAWADMTTAANDIARSAEMRPELFGRMMQEIMRDPSGSRALKWMYQRIVLDKDEDDMAELATIFNYGIKKPAQDQDSTAYQHWLQIGTVLFENGYQPTTMDDDVIQEYARKRLAPDDVPNAWRSLGIKPELQGGPGALQAARQRRPR